jgi:hypothetical protein
MSTPETQPPAAAPLEAPTTVAVPTSDIIDLYSGKELNESNALKLAVERPVRLIVTGGPVDFGKTTLLTTLYELFQSNPVAGQRFAGSMTLPAFEQKCHLARLASRNLRPNTQRTVYKPDPEYLHLRTSSTEVPTNQTDFLFTDVSGEMFERAIDSQEECKHLTFVKRANHLLLLFDTSKALRPNRWAMLQNSKTLLRSFLDNDMLSPYCVVTVVWSKYDYFEAASAAEKKALTDFRALATDQFQNDFGTRVADLRFKDIAAQPLRRQSLGLGKGVHELFSDWVSDSTELRKIDLHPNGLVGARESDRFAQRYSADGTNP